MSEPIFIPKDNDVFLHSHTPGLLRIVDSADNAAPRQYCTSYRPVVAPGLKQEMLAEGLVGIQGFTPCGQEVRWRLK